VKIGFSIDDQQELSQADELSPTSWLLQAGS